MINKGILYRTRVYLAGNIENCSNPNWRVNLKKKLNKLGIICLDPTQQVFREQIKETEETKKKLLKARKNGDYITVHNFMAQVVQKDCRQIDISDWVIINLDYTKFTAGTITEITIASAQKKPMLFLVKKKNKMPLWLVGLCNMNYVFESEGELINLLKQINDGKHKIDPKYWKILVNELK